MKAGFAVSSVALSVALGIGVLTGGAVYAAQANARGNGSSVTPAPAPRANAVTVPTDYLIGAGDVLSIVFWREPDISGDVVVRPDGKISVPLIKEVAAAGLTPSALELQLTEIAKRFLQEPNATVVVREIRSRQVYITGNVARPGAYPLAGPTTVLQFIALAGGVLEYADAENVRIMRTAGGRGQALKFNYKDVAKGKNLAQNIELAPGDTVIVP